MSMRLEECINQMISGKLRLIDYPVVNFTGDSYAPTLVSIVRSYYKDTYGVDTTVTSEDQLAKLSENASPQHQISLFTTTTARFVVTHELTDPKKNQLVQTLLDTKSSDQRYVIWSKETVVRDCFVIELPKAVDAKLLKALSDLARLEMNDSMMQFIKSFLSKGSHVLTIEQACVLLQYMRVLGSSADKYLEHIVDIVVKPEASLFLLSQYFFSKSASHFYRLWDSVQSLYPDLFWITFWSEQLYRTAEYVHLQKNKQAAVAKQISYRLPFSFINTDWKKFSYDELTRAHECVYELDHALKNGQEVSLDILYHCFFSDFFAH